MIMQYSIENKIWQTVLRVLSLITLFIGAYSLVQGILVFIRDIARPELSMLVVVIYLLVTPLGFVAALLFAYAIHRIVSGREAINAVVYGFAAMVLASVDNLIYIGIHHSGDAISFYVLGAIFLICYAILFLYYQNMGTYAMALCSGVLLVAGTVLELEEAIRYFISINVFDFTGYYFSQSLLDTLLAVTSLLFVVALKKVPPIDRHL